MLCNPCAVRFWSSRACLQQSLIDAILYNIIYSILPDLCKPNLFASLKFTNHETKIKNGTKLNYSAKYIQNFDFESNSL